jgi:hypothetical protein
VVASLCLFGEPVYKENDDCFLAMVGSGFGVALHPEPHLVFAHFGYGLILGALTHLIGLNAHGWVTIFSIWLSLALLLGASLRSGNRQISLAIALVCLGCVFCSALLSAEFTITAGILFGAVIANELASYQSTTKQRSIFRDAILIFALTLSYLIRPESFQMGLCIVLPALIFFRFSRTDKKRRAGRLALFLIVIAVLGLASEKIAYSLSPDWRQIPEYNDLRSQFVDYHRVPWSQEAPEYTKVKWSYYDYSMFNQWYMRDPIFCGENLSFLVRHLSIPLATMAPAQMREWFSLPFFSWPLLLTLGAQFAIWLLLQKKHRWPGLLLLFGEVAVITAAALTGREALDYVWATAAAITLMSLCALLVASPGGALFSLFSLRQYGVTLLSVIGLIALGCVLIDHSRTLREVFAYRDWVTRNREWFNGKVTVWSDSLLYEWLITPTRIYPPFPELHFATIDDINCMPVETTMLRAMGIDDLAKDLCNDPDTRLIASTSLMEILPHFCEEHYGVFPVYKEAARWQDLGIYILDHQVSATAASK